ncbi:hypothetical protein [Aquimarina rhabdastrellae]
METSQILEIAYAIFLILISYLPCYVIYKIGIGINTCSVELKTHFTTVVKLTLDLTTRWLESCEVLIKESKGLEVEMKALGEDTTKLYEQIQQIEALKQEVTNIETASFNGVEDVKIPLSQFITYNSDFIRFKTKTVGGAQVPIDLRFTSPFSFREIKLQTTKQQVNVPGLIEVQEGFRKVNQFSVEIKKAFETIENYFGKAKVVIDRSNHMLHTMYGTIEEMSEMNKEVKRINQGLESIQKIYKSKFKKPYRVALIIGGMIYIHWASNNIIEAVRIILKHVHLFTH